VKVRNALIAGAISISAVAGLVSPVYGAQASTLKADTLRADRCSLSVNIARPRAWNTETLRVASTAARTTVQVRIRYKTVSHTWPLTTAANGRTYHSFGVGRPTRNYRVTLAGTVIRAPRGYRTGATCYTSFVPR
jgi:hypothetical protein